MLLCRVFHMFDNSLESQSYVDKKEPQACVLVKLSYQLAWYDLCQVYLIKYMEHHIYGCYLNYCPQRVCHNIDQVGYIARARNLFC